MVKDILWERWPEYANKNLAGKQLQLIVNFDALSFVPF